MKYPLVLLLILLVNQISGLRDFLSLSNKPELLPSRVNNVEPRNLLAKPKYDDGSKDSVFPLHKSVLAVAKKKTKVDKTSGSTDAPSKEELSYKAYSAYLNDGNKSRKKRESKNTDNSETLHSWNEKNVKLEATPKDISRIKRSALEIMSQTDEKNLNNIEIIGNIEALSKKTSARHRVARGAKTNGVDANGSMNSDGDMNADVDSPAGSSSMNSTTTNNKKRGNKGKKNGNGDNKEGGRRGGKRRGNRRNKGRRKNGEETGSSAAGSANNKEDMDEGLRNGPSTSSGMDGGPPRAGPARGGPSGNGSRSESVPGTQGSRMEDSSMSRESSEELPRGNSGGNMGGEYQSKMGSGSTNANKDGVNAKMDWTR